MTMTASSVRNIMRRMRERATPDAREAGLLGCLVRVEIENRCRSCASFAMASDIERFNLQILRRRELRANYGLWSRFLESISSSCTIK
jgi:hypothetical protein